LTNASCFNVTDIPPRIKSNALTATVHRVQDVPGEERNIKTLVNDINLRELGLLHPNCSTRRAPAIPVEEADPAVGDVEITPVGETEEQGAVGEEREREKRKERKERKEGKMPEVRSP